MKLVLTELDFEEALGKGEVAARFRRQTELLDPEDATPLLDELPKVLARKLRRIIPEGFDIHEVQLSLELGGTVFGVGLKGEAVVTFGPRKT